MLMQTTESCDPQTVASYLFDLACVARKEFHEAKRRGDRGDAALLGLLKSACVFVAVGLAADGYRVGLAHDQTHIDLLSVRRRSDRRALHVPRRYWDAFRRMRDDAQYGGLKA